MTQQRTPSPRPSRSTARAPTRAVVRNKRKIPRQATSNVAFVRETPQPGDPLLDFAPVVTRNVRKNSITPDLQREFIAHLAANGIVIDAARHIGRSAEALYRLRLRPDAAGFRMAWERALDWSMTRLEDSAFARALNGEEKPIIHAGKVIGTERRHNEALVMFFLRNRLPHRYDQQKEVGPGHPLYEKVAAAYAAEQARQDCDPAAEAARRKQIDVMIAGWYRGFSALWEERLALVGIDLNDPVFAERAAALKAEGRWPEEHPERFGIKPELL
jgi:hypothetical protein